MGLEAVDRMVSVLSALRDGQAAHGADATLNEICERTGLSRSAASRFLNALTDHDFVYRSANGTFSLGPVPAGFGNTALGHRRLAELAHPSMRKLADDVQEAVCISVLDGTETQTVHQVGVEQPVFVENWVDRRWPILPTGSAISIMSTWSPTRIAERIAQLPKKQQSQIDDAVASARAHPVSWSEDNYVHALTSVSAPILDLTGTATCALIIYGPSFRFPKDRGRRTIEKKLVTIAAQISKELY